MPSLPFCAWQPWRPPPSGRFAALFVVTATLGSTVVFLSSKAYIYHEAILWGSVFTTYAYLAFLIYWRTAAAAALVWACVLSAAALFTRASVAAGVLVLALVLTAALTFRWRRPAAHLAILTGALCAMLAAYAAVNHAKFGTILDPMPVRYYAQFTPERMARTGGRFLHLSNLSFGVRVYLLRQDIGFRPSFPWLTLTLTAPPYDPARVKLDLIEPYAALPWAMPALCMLSVLGIVSLIRKPAGRYGVLAILAASGCCFPILFSSMLVTYRYEHDVYPFLLFAGATGLESLPRVSNGQLRRVGLSLALLAAMWSGYANSAFAITYQREICWGVEGRLRTSFRDFRHSVDARVLRLLNR